MALTNKQLLELLGLRDTGTGQTLGHRPSSRLRLLHQGPAQPPPRPDHDRRVAPRLTTKDTRWARQAMVRPAMTVSVVDISVSGALIESTTRLHTGTRAELHLVDSADGSRRLVGATVRRCFVANVSPMTFRAALEFETPLALERLEAVLATARSGQTASTLEFLPRTAAR